MLAEIIQVLISGGPVMVALAITSLLLYKTIIGLLLFVRRVRFEELAQPREHSLAAADRDANGNVPVPLKIKMIDETFWRFRQLIRGRLRYSHALIIAAPLFGLLGTVEGMLATFRGTALDLSHEVTRTVAEGISRALITTATGLFVAIPALFLINWIKREFQRHELRLIERKVQLLANPEPGAESC